MKMKWWKVLIALLFPLQLILLFFINSNWVDIVYVVNIYPFISNFLRIIPNQVNFSIAEIVVIGIFILLLYFLVNSIVKLKNKTFNFKNALINTFIALSIILMYFQLSWGLNYQKANLNESLNINKSPYTSEELKKLSLFLIEKCNTLRIESEKEILEQNYIRILDIAPSFFKQNRIQTSVKGVFFSKGMSYFGISGIYFPFTGEANVNMDNPFVSVPFTACHEIAHQMTFAKEDEANFVAYMVAVQNENILFKYSAYYSALRYALGELAYLDFEAYKYCRSCCSIEVLCDFEDSRNYWRSFESPLMDYSQEINDLYLKSNDQENGIETYNLFLELLVSNYEDNCIENIQIFQ